MKYLNHYTDEKVSQALDEAGAFFCFGKDQFEKKRKDNVKYVNLKYGLVCPRETAKKLLKSLDSIYKQGIKQDKEEQGVEKIILRELNNHEAFYTYDTTSTVEALEGYNITKEQVQKVFHANKHKYNN
jgi:hypothetical protein